MCEAVKFTHVHCGLCKRATSANPCGLCVAQGKPWSDERRAEARRRLLGLPPDETLRAEVEEETRF